jgi:hypothetical protein
MCLVAGTKILTARKPRPVFKVFTKGYGNLLMTPFRDLTLGEVTKTSAVGFFTGTDVTGRKAGGFGYTSFLSFKKAEKYLNKITNPNGIRNYMIIKLFIPIGSKYSISKIGMGFVGAGMTAVRSERLVKEVKT